MRGHVTHAGGHHIIAQLLTVVKSIYSNCGINIVTIFN